MSPKYLSKKTIKRQKLEKLRKEKKRKKNLNATSHEEFNDRETLSLNDFSHYRLCERKKHSRCCVSDKYSSKVKHFSQIREQYFSCLQTVVMNNCVYCNSHVTRDMLENLSLELEQDALLACLQADIYEKSMTKIISEIEKCTEEKQIYSEVKKLLPNLSRKEPLQMNMKTEKSYSPARENISQIPTISNTRSDYDINSGRQNTCSNQRAYNSDTFNLYLSAPTQYQEAYNEMHSNSQRSDFWLNNEHYDAANNNSNFWSNENEMSQSNEITSNNNFEGTQKYSVTPPSRRLQNCKTKPISRVPPQTTNENEKGDPLSLSRIQLQKSVEQTLTQAQAVSKERLEEKERAHIAHILQGDDSLDSLSDVENESKENVDETNLMSRLEKMREIFGIEDEKKDNPTVAVPANPKPSKSYTKADQINITKRRPTIWKHEKVIQLYKFAMLSSEMSFYRRQENRRLFRELFGEDSDEEHEIEYRSEEKYRLSCSERISSWIVKYLMPHYHNRRIIGRNVFKSLGHHVSDTIIDKIQYPDEWTVKYFVSKFFPPRKKYICDSDVSAFILD